MSFTTIAPTVTRATIVKRNVTSTKSMLGKRDTTMSEALEVVLVIGGTVGLATFWLYLLFREA